jgi:hypothetical protein
LQGLTQNVIDPLNAVAKTPFEYTGPQYIGETALQQDAAQQQQNFFQGSGPNTASGILGSTNSAWQNALDPYSFLNAQGAMNPLRQFSKEVGRNLDENIRPGYARAANMAGQYGGYSSRRDLQGLLAQRNASEAIADAGSSLFTNLINQGLEQRRQAMQFAPTLMNIGQMPGAALYNLGSRERAEEQRRQALSNQQTQFAQMEPYMRAQQYSGLVSPLLQAETTGSKTDTKKNSPNLIGMGLSAAMMGMSPFSMGGAGASAGMGMPPTGMGMGGGMTPVYNPYAPWNRNATTWS